MGSKIGTAIGFILTILVYILFFLPKTPEGQYGAPISHRLGIIIPGVILVGLGAWIGDMVDNSMKPQKENNGGSDKPDLPT